MELKAKANTDCLGSVALRYMFHADCSVLRFVLWLRQDDTEYMALWAANTCSDWDLYLTIVADDDTGKHALAYAGADLSERRGCYETMQEDVGACEFYMPHGGDNFGVLFSGGFHAIWHEHEWEYNP